MAAETIAQATALSAADIAILAEDLSYADAVAPGLSAQLLRFLMEGEQPPLLADPTTLDRSKLFEALAPRNYTNQKRTDDEVKRAASRTRLHDLERFDPLIMVRFGYVVAIGRNAVLGRMSLAGTETTPAWLPILCEIDQSFPDAAGRRLLSAARCRDMLALEGSSIKPLVECLFVNNDVHYQNHQAWAFALPGLAEVLAKDPPAVLEAMRAFEPRAAMMTIDFLADAGLLDQPAFLDGAFGWVALKKGVGQSALRAMARAPQPMLRERVEAYLASRVAAERQVGARVAAACLDDPLPLLAAHAETETSKSVLQAIEEARTLFAASASAESTGAREDGAQGYVAADGSYVAAPPFVEPSPSRLLPDAHDALAALVADINAAASAEHEAQRQQLRPDPVPPHTEPDGSMTEFWAEIHARSEQGRLARNAVLSAPYEPPLSANAVGPLLDVLSGAAPPASARSFYSWYWGLVGNPNLTKTYKLAQKRMKAFFARPDVDWRHLARLKLIHDGIESYAWSNFFHGLATGGLRRHDAVDDALARRLTAGVDIRALVALLGEHGIAEAWLMGRVMATGSRLACSETPLSSTFWTLLSSRFDKLDAAVNSVAVSNADKSAFALLGVFPKLPRRHLTLVLDAALSSDKAVRLLARQLARRAGDLVTLIGPLIEAGEAPRRLAAIRWLGELRDPATVPVLRKALSGKRNLVDRAALVAALAACGDDISDLFAPATLLDEARAGLAKTKSDFSALFDADNLPILHWADGSAVAPELVRWWFTAAHKLKQPGGDALLHMALDRLAPHDAAKLGESVLAAFVAHDTRQLDASEAEVAAKAELATRMRARSWDKTFTAEMAMADLRAEKLGSYPQSAHEHRGLLALARHAPGPIAAEQARHMLVKHWRRTPQGKAMLDYLASNPASAALQALIGVSQRHKTAAVQAYAVAIADRLAEERDWTRDELEDRTVPTADLDETGGINLPIGVATYRAELDEEAALCLRHPDGKTIAALPSPKEFAEEAKAAKATLFILRKALKQTVEAQRRRLHEAMCAGRVWPSGDFRASCSPTRSSGG